MIFSLDQVLQWLIIYRYHLLFPLMVVEGPIVTIIGGFLSSLGYFNIFVMYLVAVFADLLGDSIYYAIGRFGGRRFMDKWGHCIGITSKRVARIEKHFEKHSGKTLVIGKLSQGLSGVFLVSAGAAKMPFWRFLWLNIAVTVPKDIVTLLIGFYFGKAYVKINNYLDYTSIITILLAAVFIAAYVMIRRFSKKYEEKVSN